MSKETPTTTPMPMPTTIPMPMPTMTTVLTTDTPTMTNMPTEEEHIDYKECTQKDVAWEVNQPHRGIMRVRAYNNDTVNTQLDFVSHLSGHHHRKKLKLQ